MSARLLAFRAAPAVVVAVTLQPVDALAFWGSSKPSAPIVAIGETLFDSTPAGIFLGGAPGNVAVHLAELGEPVEFASRVGDDVLGREATRRLGSYGVSTKLVQIEPKPPGPGGGDHGDAAGLETGFVLAELSATGDATYTFATPAAWDRLAPAPELLAAARGARALVYGSLGARAAASKATIFAAIGAAPRRVFDVNLRPPYVDAATIVAGARGAWLLKLNDDELPLLAEMLGVRAPAARFADAAPGDAAAAADAAERDAARAVCEACGASVVCVTRGARGAALWCDGAWHTHPGFAVDARDTIGAGDAFLAQLLAALLPDGRAPPRAPADALARACALGAFVAGKPGATPKHDKAAIDAILATA